MNQARELRALREDYGLPQFGQSCLAARSVVEAGGRFVTVFRDCYGQSLKDILATAFHLLGIDPETTVPDLAGRPYPIAGDRKVRVELLG